MICEKGIKLYCCEDASKIENYKEAVNSSEKWVCHHRLETHNSDGERRSVDLTMKELIALDMYYRRPASELIFLKPDEHHRLHSKGKPGKQHSEEEKRKISEARKGKKYGPRSEETRRKISEANKGRKFGPLSEETKKKMSKATKGRHWFNNGVKSVMAFECPEGFRLGRV